MAAAHLVEQLNHWPQRQQQLRGLIAKSLIAATVAGELGASIEYAQPGQLFTGALLYSIGDLAIAYQAPEIHQAVQASMPSRNSWRTVRSKSHASSVFHVWCYRKL